jgi:hypothetical protein
VLLASPVGAPPCGNREVRREVVEQEEFFVDAADACERIDPDAMLEHAERPRCGFFG